MIIRTPDFIMERKIALRRPIYLSLKMQGHLKEHDGIFFLLPEEVLFGHFFKSNRLHKSDERRDNIKEK